LRTPGSELAGAAVGSCARRLLLDLFSSNLVQQLGLPPKLPREVHDGDPGFGPVKSGKIKVCPERGDRTGLHKADFFL
jgi:hypothetical protein